MEKYNNILNEIRLYYPKFTKSEKKVADFVLHSPKKVLQLTITDLANICNVGDTTVFRFCRSLKTNGYQDFRLSLALTLNSTQTFDIKDNKQVIDANNIIEVSNRIVNTYQSAVIDTFKLLDYDKINEAVNLLLNARNIYFFGLGGSGITAFEAQNKFLKIMSNVFYTVDKHMQLMTAALLSKEDVAVIFTNSGVTKDIIEISKSANKSGAKLILITKFLQSPCAAYSNVLLLSGAVEGPMQGGSIAAKVSQLYMVDLLYAEYFRKLDEVAVENKKITSKTISNQML